jgi:tRNA threonylcarbamoyladenosine biosynthesis protein TsaB
MLLAIDTTSSACSCALYQGGFVASREHFGEKGHAEILLPQIEALLGEANCKITDVKKIVVTTGPGSFTGVRVGIAAARGLGLSLDCKLVGITSFEALAAAVMGSIDDNNTVLNIGQSFTAVIDARRGQVYFQSFVFAGKGVKPQPVGEGVAMDIDAAKEHFKNEPSIFVGGGAKLVGSGGELLTNENFQYILAKNFCANFGLFVGEGVKPPVPLYLRAPDAAPSFSFLNQGVK